MVSKIRLENFKCFRNLEIPLRSLNLFTGLNCVGKSSIIQALLLIRQSYQQGYSREKICLNGDYISLGTGWDILYEYAEKNNEFDTETVTISVQEDSNQFTFVMNYSKDADVLDVINAPVGEMNFLTCPFEYLSAERASPQTIYPKSSFHIDTIKQLGNHGQYAIHYLTKYQDASISWDSCDGKEKYLKGALQYWLHQISPKVKIDVQNIDNTDLSKIGYYFSDKEKSNTFRPTNIGFGVSYVLPVIVALLKASSESIIIIENPEAHLHPKGQRMLGELIAKCAATGAQIFVETHSDHVLNGIRIAVKKEFIQNTDVNLFFFCRESDRDTVESIVEQPKIEKNGKLSYWPDNFFDEWEKALDEII